jgi:hypothetical protein
MATIQNDQGETTAKGAREADIAVLSLIDQVASADIAPPSPASL